MSLAEQLANQARGLKANPNKAPLQPADVDMDKLAIAAQLQAMQNLPEAPSGSYIAKRLHYLILKDGSKVLPTNGFYIPQTQEQYDMLKYYNELNTGLVELVAEEE